MNTATAKASTTDLGPPLPSNLDAERGVLGAVLLDNNALKQATIQQEDFFLEQHRKVFAQMRALAEKQQPIDLITLTDALQRGGELELAGGAAYIASLADGMPRVSNVAHYAKIVRENSRRRELVHAAERIQHAALESEGTPESVANVAAQTFRDLAQGSAPDVLRLTLTPAQEIEMQALDWLWPDRIPLGKLTLFCGDPDMGKSLCVADVVATVTTGRKWPDAENPHLPAHVAMLCGEDEWEDTVKPRLFAAGADLTRVHRVNPIETEFKGKKAQRAPALDKDIESFEQMLYEHPEIRFLTFDPLASYLGDVNRNLEKEIRRILDAVKELAEHTGVTILVADHFNKNLNSSSVHRVAGSTSVVGAPRAVWGFIKDPDNADERIMVRIKCNVTKKRTGLRYGFGERMLTVKGKLVSTPYIIWTGKTDITADEAFARNADPVDAKLTKAVRWLQAFLADGPKLASDVYAEGERHGYDDQFLKRQVRQRAGVEKPYQECRRWMWRLSEHSDASSEASEVFAATSDF